ncbi:RHS repeat domain-containing protein [Candidatus Amarobacter glycogenicus]|uniref:RHS repeat domain-containing protein n=1 Tax=Candidatus Amarobacter glycogenicus TaxID=3140699 RepID=UPI0031356BC7|nr:RHS repeat protein [Dehalococcoidia bacterium]
MAAATRTVPESVTDWNSNSTTYSYDDAGRMTSTTLPSGTGIVSTNTYDNANRLTGITHVKARRRSRAWPTPWTMSATARSG